MSAWYKQVKAAGAVGSATGSRKCKLQRNTAARFFHGRREQKPMGHTTKTEALSKQPWRGQLLAIRHYLYVTEGRPFSIEVQETKSGHLTAHAESTSDPHEAIHSQSATNLDDVLQAITLEIDAKVCKW